MLDTSTTRNDSPRHPASYHTTKRNQKDVTKYRSGTPTQIIVMEGMIYAGLRTLEEMKLSIPAAAFEHSFGLVLLEAVQVGFIFSAGVGTGILLRHDKQNKTWSPPLAIGISNVGAGLAAGLERKHVVIFLTEDQMMHAMASDFSFRLGIQSSVAAGPIGEEHDLTAHIGTEGAGVTSSYTHVRGLYVGLEMEGAMLGPRDRVNEQFYGDIPPKKILFGVVENMPKLKALDRLHTKLNELAAAADPDPAYAETIASPFVKNTAQTETLDTKK